jgi:hypothetical protein
MDETDFCKLDCKYRADPKSITTAEIGKLLERGREENWAEHIKEIVDADQSYENGYDEGVRDSIVGE